MTRRRLIRYAAAFAALTAWNGWGADSDLDTRREAFEAASNQQWRDLILAPIERGASGELVASTAPELPQLKQLALAELRDADVTALLGGDAPLDNWMPSLTRHFAFLDQFSDIGYGSEWLTVQIQQGPLPGTRVQRLPAWVTPAVRGRIAAFKPVVNATALVSNRTLWEGEANDTVGDAMVWSGPAVKDGVARYQTSGPRGQERTLVRLAAWPSQTADLLRWAPRHNVALTLTLDDSSQPLSLAQPVPVRIDLSVPVWLVTPQELLPATLKALHTGDACHGGGWIEVELPGARQPAIWGTLFLPNAASGTTAQVHRLPPEKPGEGTTATIVSRVEVAWPDRRLNALLLTAKQFGHVWGTQADVLVMDNGQPNARRLSGSGKPACPI